LSRTMGKCRCLPQTRPRGSPVTSVCGLAQGEPRGQSGRGSQRAARLLRVRSGPCGEHAPTASRRTGRRPGQEMEPHDAGSSPAGEKMGQRPLRAVLQGTGRMPNTGNLLAETGSGTYNRPKAFCSLTSRFTQRMEPAGIALSWRVSFPLPPPSLSLADSLVPQRSATGIRRQRTARNGKDGR
jgi:hypothetical protein